MASYVDLNGVRTWFDEHGAGEPLVEPVLTTADLSRVTSRTLVMLGDDDVVMLEHAIELYRALPNSEQSIDGAAQ